MIETPTGLSETKRKAPQGRDVRNRMQGRSPQLTEEDRATTDQALQGRHYCTGEKNSPLWGLGALPSFSLSLAKFLILNLTLVVH